MSNYNYYRANMISAISLQKDMDQLRCLLSHMEQSYGLWCHQVDLPIKYRRYNQYQLYEELLKASEIHEERLTSEIHEERLTSEMHEERLKGVGSGVLSAAK